MSAVGEPDLDSRVRTRAFQFLSEQLHLHGGQTLAQRVLSRGFDVDGRRVPLMGPQGIFKPAILTEMPLTIRTAPVVEGEPRPYDDAVGPDGFWRYHYRGTDPMHRDNQLREADGPMLLHGLQGFQGKRIVEPHAQQWRPRPEFLAGRYEIFRQAS